MKFPKVFLALFGLVAIVSVFLFEFLGTGVIDTERDIIVTLITGAALAVVIYSVEPPIIRRPLVGALLASTIVLFPPIDAGILVCLVFTFGLLIDGLRQSSSVERLIQIAGSFLVSVIASALLQWFFGGPLLTTGEFPIPGNPTVPGLLAIMAIGALWWIALTAINSPQRFLSSRDHTFTRIQLVGLALAGLGVGAATSFWSVLGSVATNIVVTSVVLGLSVVLLGLSHAIDRRRLERERDKALKDSESNRQYLAEAVARADQTLVDLYAGIHDGPLQEFSAANAYADLASEKDSSDSGWARQKELLTQGVSDLRALLRREVIQESSASSNLEDVVQHVTRMCPQLSETKISIEAPLNLWNSLPHDVHNAFTLIAQEALLNAAKYANADSIEIRFFQRDTNFILEVIDDGIGLSRQTPPPTNEVHLGQTLMQLRMARVNGTLKICDAPNRGTVLIASVTSL